MGVQKEQKSTFLTAVEDREKEVRSLFATFVDGSVRRIRKASSEIIPKQLRTKHATLEFLLAY